MGVLVGVKVLLVLLDEVVDGEELLGELVLGEEDALGDCLGDLVHLRRVQSLLMPVPSPTIPPTTKPVTPPEPCIPPCPVLLPLLNRLEQLLVIMLIQPFLQLEQLRDLYQRLLLLTIDDVLVLGGVAAGGKLGALVLGGVVALDATETAESVAAVLGVQELLLLLCRESVGVDNVIILSSIVIVLIAGVIVIVVATIIVAVTISVIVVVIIALIIIILPGIPLIVIVVAIDAVNGKVHVFFEVILLLVVILPAHLVAAHSVDLVLVDMLDLVFNGVALGGEAVWHHQHFTLLLPHLINGMQITPTRRPTQHLIGHLVLYYRQQPLIELQ